MDVLTGCLVVALGSLVGVVTGLLPGLHVNSLAAAALVVGASGMEWALALVAVGTVHTIVNILPTTYLGAPGEDTALARLPTHRMLMEGRGPTAVRVSVHASLFAIVVTAVVVLPYKWLLLEPGGLLPVIVRWRTPLLAGALLLLLASERSRGWRGIVRAAVAMAFAASLGVVAFDWPVQALIPGPASALLPLLSGLFGAASLLVALRHAPQVPAQISARPGRYASASMMGVAAAGVTAVLPGITAAVATTMTPQRDDPRHYVAALSAINSAHMMFALVVLWIIGRTRSGLAIATESMVRVEPWVVGVPDQLLVFVAAVLGAAACGALATLALDRVVSRHVHRVPPRMLAAVGLGILVTLVVILSGPTGFVLFAASATVGLLPYALNVRRVHLAAALIVPILLRG